MDINQLIAIIKKKLLNQIEIDNILIEDKLKVITLAYTQLKNTYRKKIDT